MVVVRNLGQLVPEEQVEGSMVSMEVVVRKQVYLEEMEEPSVQVEVVAQAVQPTLVEMVMPKVAVMEAEAEAEAPVKPEAEAEAVEQVLMPEAVVEVERIW